ncbi:hypothetical protein DRJ48_02560 [Candidatus Woesearchaeota archaeon]|nr:MAG: hypothetical protein DRJ48_02560 [Candidatus Woesearchaeota archaeon]
MEIKLGCCGWGFFNAKQRIGSDWKLRFKTKLQAYSTLFDLVEVNSTFYKLPKKETAERWLDEATKLNPGFEFTVKCSQIVTHEDRFETEASIEAYASTLEIAKALKASVLLLQTPASFKPTKQNLNILNSFLKRIRKPLQLAWEPRGDWLKRPNLIKKICKAHKLIHCVDPLRADPASSTRVQYFRLHGFGKQMVYNYRFSKSELLKILDRVKQVKAERVYVLFNNYYMYENCLEFKHLIAQVL